MPWGKGQKQGRKKGYDLILGQETHQKKQQYYIDYSQKSRSGPNRKNTIAVLKKMMPELAADGIVFVRLSDMVK